MKSLLAEDLNIDDEFCLDNNHVYLNHAMASPWPRRTGLAVARFAEENMHFGQIKAAQWEHTDQQLRMKLRRLLNADSVNDLALLKNTSEGLSTIAYGLDWQRGSNVVTAEQEFPSNRFVWESLIRLGVETHKVDLFAGDDPEGALMQACDENTRLLSISSVQYASGLRMDLNRLGQFCRSHGILFCIDAIQSLGAIPFDVHACHADFVVAGSHKWMMAPEGLAVFWSHPAARVLLNLNQFGWRSVEKLWDFDAQNWEIAKTARRFESGTTNSVGITGLNESLQLIESMGVSVIFSELTKRVDYLETKLRGLSGIEVLTSSDPSRRSGLLVFKHRSISTQMLHESLSDKGVFCAKRGEGIRWSPQFFTPYERLDRAIALLEESMVKN